MPKKPEVGLRFTTSRENESIVRQLYVDAGFDNFSLDSDEDGLITFIFPKMDSARMFALVSAIPSHYSALQGFVINPGDDYIEE